jgi:hypothetical protein
MKTTNSTRITNMGLMLVMAGSAIMGAIVGGGIVEARTPTLVGFGCAGIDAPAMGIEEDEFPACDAIVRVEQLSLARSS